MSAQGSRDTAQERRYVVSGYSGQAGGLSLHRFEVTAPNQREALRRIKQSTQAFAWDGEPIRQWAVRPVLDSEEESRG